MDDKHTNNDSFINEHAATADEINENAGEKSENTATLQECQNETGKLRRELDDMKDKYVRLAAEFDNFKKRTAKEKLELIQTASKDVIVSLLDALDDANRAQQQLETSTDLDQVRQGVMLVFNKLWNIMHSKGLKPMDAKGRDFNPDLHEAVAEIPAGPELTGKIVDEVQKGYYLNGQIIRFAKVVVGK